MSVTLTKKPKNAIVISGFPGYGLVGTVATGYLIDVLKCERIGQHWFEDLPANIAIHEGEVVEPIGIYYDKKNNIVIIHSIIATNGIEWKAADLVLDICKQVNAKELICIEGVGSSEQDKNRGFYYCKSKTACTPLEKKGYTRLTEGIIMGVTSALMLKNSPNLLCIFAETHMNLPDSKAAAKAIEVLDAYTKGFNIDFKPLLKQAQEFEEKIKTLLQKSSQAQEEKDKKQLNYVG